MFGGPSALLYAWVWKFSVRCHAPTYTTGFAAASGFSLTGDSSVTYLSSGFVQVGQGFSCYALAVGLYRIVVLHSVPEFFEHPCLVLASW